MGVASGIYDVVMVVGVEKMTCQPTPRVTEILAGAGDCATEVKAGSTFPSLFAMIARRHMHDFGTTREHLSAVAVKNHENGALNPDAQMRKVITLEQAMNARPIAEPLNLYDCSLISDGAAAVVLCAADRAREFSDQPVKVLGVAQASDFVALDQKPDITTFAAVRGAAKKAYAMAGLGPKRYPIRRTARLLHHRRDRRDGGSGLRANAGAADSSRAEGGTRRDGPDADQRQRRVEIERPSGGRDGRGADLRSGPADPLRSGRAAVEAAFGGAGAESRRQRRHLRRHDTGGILMCLASAGIVYTETVVHLAPGTVRGGCALPGHHRETRRRRQRHRPRGRRARRIDDRVVEVRNLATESLIFRKQI